MNKEDIPRCETCVHWAVDARSGGYYGRCTGIERDGDLSVNLGYEGGFVTSIDTEKGFGCVNHSELKD